MNGLGENSSNLSIISGLWLFFFSLGCALGTDKAQLIHLNFSARSSYYLFLLWLALVSLTTYLFTYEEPSFTLTILSDLAIVVGILAVWSCYDHIAPGQITKYSALFGYSFFIFVFHEPLLTILKKGMFFLFGRTDACSLFIYIAAPLITIGTSILLAHVLKRHLPSFYDFATGGR